MSTVADKSLINDKSLISVLGGGAGELNSLNSPIDCEIVTPVVGLGEGSFLASSTNFLTSHVNVDLSTPRPVPAVSFSSELPGKGADKWEGGREVSKGTASKPFKFKLKK